MTRPVRPSLVQHRGGRIWHFRWTCRVNQLSLLGIIEAGGKNNRDIGEVQGNYKCTTTKTKLQPLYKKGRLSHCFTQFRRAEVERNSQAINSPESESAVKKAWRGRKRERATKNAKRRDWLKYIWEEAFSSRGYLFVLVQCYMPQQALEILIRGNKWRWLRVA